MGSLLDPKSAPLLFQPHKLNNKQWGTRRRGNGVAGEFRKPLKLSSSPPIPHVQCMYTHLQKLLSSMSPPPLLVLSWNPQSPFWLHKYDVTLSVSGCFGGVDKPVQRWDNAMKIIEFLLMLFFVFLLSWTVLSLYYFLLLFFVLPWVGIWYYSELLWNRPIFC